MFGLDWFGILLAFSFLMFVWNVALAFAAFGRATRLGILEDHVIRLQDTIDNAARRARHARQAIGDSTRDAKVRRLHKEAHWDEAAVGEWDDITGANR